MFILNWLWFPLAWSVALASLLWEGFRSDVEYERERIGNAWVARVKANGYRYEDGHWTRGPKAA